MKKQEIIEYYGSVRMTAVALKITVQAVYAWKDPPSLSVQNKIEWETGHRLLADNPRRRKNDST